jgi:O-antigen/teichoic acid export membrane protein
MHRLRYLARRNRVILANSVSLMATTVVTSGLGFAYWWLAARSFTAESIGVGSAAISAMFLLGTAGTLGFTTLLIHEIPRRPGQVRALVSGALVISGVTSALLGLGFVLVAPAVSSQLPLARSVADVLVFVAGVSSTAVGFVADQALIGLLLGTWQLWRNIAMAAIKLVALVALARLMGGTSAIAIVGAWAIGNCLSLALAAALIAHRRRGASTYVPAWGLVSSLGRSAAVHHAYNLTVMTPWMTLPIVAATLVTARQSGLFYPAYLMAGSLFLVPGALSSVLFAVGAHDPQALEARTRFTLGLSAAMGLAAVIIVEPISGRLMGLFGHSYGVDGAALLRLLILAFPAQVIKSHYVAISRIRGRVSSTLPFIIAVSTCEVIAASVGAMSGGIDGLVLGWLVVVVVESVAMAPAVLQTAGLRRKRPAGHDVAAAVSAVQQPRQDPFR